MSCRPATVWGLARMSQYRDRMSNVAEHHAAVQTEPACCTHKCTPCSANSHLIPLLYARALCSFDVQLLQLKQVETNITSHCAHCTDKDSRLTCLQASSTFGMLLTVVLSLAILCNLWCLMYPVRDGSSVSSCHLGVESDSCSTEYPALCSPMW